MLIASVGWFKLNQIRALFFFCVVALRIDAKYHSIVVTVVLIKFSMLYFMVEHFLNTISINK